MSTVTYLDSNFLLGNAQGCRGYPIVYCSDGFCELTGFARTEVMKKTCTCRFLRGEETSERVTQQVQKTLEGQREYQAEVRYYRKNGTESDSEPKQMIALYLDREHLQYV